MVARVRTDRCQGWTRRIWTATGALKLVCLLATLAACTGSSSPSREPTTGPPRATTAPVEAARPATAEPAPVELKLAYSAQAAGMALVKVTEDAGLFRKYGLVTSPTFVDGPARAVPALMHGDIDVTVTGAAPALTAIAQNPDLVIVACIATGWSHSLWAEPTIRGPEDLVGKNVGITAIHSLDHEGILDRLRAWNIDPSTITFVVIAGGIGTRFAALQSGSVSMVALEPPLTSQARDAGFVELADLSKVPSPIATTVLLSTRAYVDRNQEAVRRLISAYVDGVQVYRTDEASTIRSLAAFLDRTAPEDREALLETREFWSRRYTNDLRPSIEGLRLTIQMTSLANSAVAGLTPEQVVDTRGFTN